jgi:hypothetical protein
VRWRENGLSVLDWIWYIALPYLAYALALLTGIGVLRDDPRALPALAADLVFLMLIGIRNAWDLAVWMPQQERKPGQPDIGAERARRSSPAFKLPAPSRSGSTGGRPGLRNPGRT